MNRLLVFLFLLILSITKATRHFLLDVDLGRNPDALLGLMYSLTLDGKKFKQRIVGISTVGAESALGQRLGRKMLTMMRKDRYVPCFRGENTPMTEGLEFKRNGWEGFLTLLWFDSNWTKDDSEMSAVDAIISLSKRYKDLEIVSLGPMTNIARALEKDKGLVDRLKMIHVVQSFQNDLLDNFWEGDPVASNMVLSSAGDRLHVISTNETVCSLGWEHYYGFQSRAQYHDGSAIELLLRHLFVNQPLQEYELKTSSRDIQYLQSVLLVNSVMSEQQLFSYSQSPVKPFKMGKLSDCKLLKKDLFSQLARYKNYQRRTFPFLWYNPLSAEASIALFFVFTVLNTLFWYHQCFEKKRKFKKD